MWNVPLKKNRLNFLNDVLDEYGNKSDYHLEQLTHLEKPWQIARQDKTSESHCSDIILKKDMRDYYSSKLRK